MEKNKIKKILREAFAPQISEEDTSNNGAGSSNKQFNKDYSEVQNKLSGTMLKQSQVMAAAGMGNPKDSTARSLFSKKVRKDKNDDGGVYLFDDLELASVIKVLSNPAAYLNTKR